MPPVSLVRDLVARAVRDCDRTLDLELSPTGMGSMDVLRIESVLRSVAWELSGTAFDFHRAGEGRRAAGGA